MGAYHRIWFIWFESVETHHSYEMQEYLYSTIHLAGCLLVGHASEFIFSVQKAIMLTVNSCSTPTPRWKQSRIKSETQSFDLGTTKRYPNVIT